MPPRLTTPNPNTTPPMNVNFSTEAIRGNRAHVARQCADLYRLLIENQNRRRPRCELYSLHLKDETDWADGHAFAVLSRRVEDARVALMQLVFELSPEAQTLLGFPAMAAEECES